MGTTVTSTTTPLSSDYVVLDPVIYLSVLWRRKFRLLGVGLLGFALAAGLSYTRPKLYEATLRFLPPTRASLPFVISLGRTSGEEYRAMLNSDTIADDVVAHLDLVHAFHAKDAYAARDIVRGMAKFNIDTNNFISITITSKDPKMVAPIANEFYAALYRKEEASSAAESQHRLNFMAGPLELEHQRLSAAEDALRDAQQKTGLVLPGAQGALGVQQVASLRNRVSDLQTQLASAMVGSTEQNPRVITLRSQIANLQGQIQSLQGGNTQSDSPGRLPQLALEVQRREREVSFHASTFESLTKALETSQMTESYTPGFILVDPAEEPRKKISPSHARWAMIGGFLGFLFALLSTLIRTIYGEWSRSPSGATVLAKARQSWRRGQSLSQAHGG